MKDKPIKQPWPRSAKITVWALGILLMGSLLLTYVVQHVLGQEIIDLRNSLPIYQEYEPCTNEEEPVGIPDLTDPPFEFHDIRDQLRWDARKKES